MKTYNVGGARPNDRSRHDSEPRRRREQSIRGFLGDNFPGGNSSFLTLLIVHAMQRLLFKISRSVPQHGSPRRLTEVILTELVTDKHIERQFQSLDHSKLRRGER